MNLKENLYQFLVVWKLDCPENPLSSILSAWGRKWIIPKLERDRNGEIKAFWKRLIGLGRFGAILDGLGGEQPGARIDGQACGAVFAGEGIFGSSF